LGGSLAVEALDGCSEFFWGEVGELGEAKGDSVFFLVEFEDFAVVVGESGEFDAFFDGICVFLVMDELPGFKEVVEVDGGEL